MPFAVHFTVINLSISFFVDLQKKQDEFKIHSKLKKVTHKKQIFSILKNANGQILLDTEDKKNEWSNYIKELFNNDRRAHDIGDEDTGPSILKSEV